MHYKLCNRANDVHSFEMERNISYYMVVIE